jgi:hypothetical protein
MAADCSYRAVLINAVKGEAVTIELLYPAKIYFEKIRNVFIAQGLTDCLLDGPEQVEFGNRWSMGKSGSKDALVSFRAEPLLHLEQSFPAFLDVNTTIFFGD